jgi:hypothetical protein
MVRFYWFNWNTTLIIVFCLSLIGPEVTILQMSEVVVMQTLFNIIPCKLNSLQAVRKQRLNM